MNKWQHFIGTVQSITKKTQKDVTRRQVAATIPRSLWSSLMVWVKEQHEDMRAQGRKEA